MSGAGGNSGDAAGRDLARLETAYRRHAAQVYTLCLRLLAGARAAEEATVEVFVRLGRELSGLWDEARTLARLRHLAVDEALARLGVRGRKAPPPARAEPRRERMGGGLPQPPDQAALDALAARLPDELRVAFVLHDGEGLDDHEIAAHLRVDEEEVRRLVRAARFELRRLWLAKR